MVNKRRKLKRPIKIIIIFTLLLVLGFGVLYKLNQYPKDLIASSSDDKNFGKQKFTKDKNKDFVKVYHFPDTNISEIKSWIQEEMNINDQVIENHLQDKHKLKVKQDYSSEEFSPYASIKLTLKINNQVVRETARTFDAELNEELSLSTLFTKAGNNTITDQMRKKFSQGDLERHDFLNKYKTDTFKEFYLSKDNLELFNSDVNQDKVIYTIPLEETRKFLAKDIGLHEKSDGFVPSVYIDQGLKNDDKLLAFTFDDGPHTVITGKLMDALEKHEGQGTFFIVGSRAEQNEDSKAMLNSILDRGHQLANHSYNHQNFNHLSVQEFNDQIDRTNQIFEEATGYAGPYMVRPPYGAANQHVRDNTQSVFVNWSVDTEDWLTHNPKMICDEILTMSEDGDIILLHDLYETSYKGFACAVDVLADEGYKFVTVEELFKARGLDYQPGEIHYDAYRQD